MKRIYTHHDRFMVWQVKQLLDNHQIPCFIKNEFVGGAVGELAPLDSLPEVWLSDNEWETRANKLIAEMTADARVGKDWCCSECGERNDASFDFCWQCGYEPEQYC